MYILLDNNIVREIIPDENPLIPGVPIDRRYPAAFVANLLHVPDDMAVAQNWVYDPDTQSFSEPEPPEPEYTPEPNPEPEPEPTPSELEILQAENKLLKAQIQAQTDRSDFIEDCIAEMAMQVYNE